MDVAFRQDRLLLKAELKIAETQIKDVKIGQPAEIDTRTEDFFETVKEII